MLELNETGREYAEEGEKGLCKWLIGLAAKLEFPFTVI